MRWQAGSKAVLAAIVALCAVSAPAQNKVLLRLHLKKGQSFKQRTITEQTVTQEPQGRKMVLEQNTGVGFTYDVQDVDAGGNAMLKVTCHWVSLKQKAPTGNAEYDSSKPGTTIPNEAKGFAGLVGQSFRMQITPEGKVLKLEGVDAMLTHMMNQLEAPAPVKKMITEQVKKQFGEKALKEMMEKTMAVYPEKPVGVGDTWSKKIVISSGFPMTLNNTWTLTVRKQGKAVVAVKSTIESNPGGTPVEMGPLKMKFDLSGKQQGVTHIDESSGWPMAANLTQNLAGKVKVEGIPGQSNMTWPITIESKIRVEEEK